MSKTTIAFVDVLGLCYDGNTLKRRGLGGSESAVISMSRELVKLNYEVHVFCDCESDDSSPGEYDSVIYRPLSDINKLQVGYDILVSLRSVAPFAPKAQEFKSFGVLPDFDKLIPKCKLRILWMHDTFCDGDHLIESLCVNGTIHKIFTLSDFHTTYVTNADHGHRRMFEVMKPYIWQTRNGINKYLDWVDITKKDPNLFVYNASVTKGMVPLVEDIWPQVKKGIQSAKLKVIGGYYRFREEHGPDEQEKKFRELEKSNKELDIEFTGVIKQDEIANIMAEASYMIYPTAFPETFGISTLEAISYNTPIISCVFGAMEETAYEFASYKIPYPIEPNSLFPNINKEEQVKRFVNMVVHVYNDKYLHQQKMYGCNMIKGIETWDTVALQWKQLFCRQLNEYMPVDEYRKVTKINNDVRRIYHRNFQNLVEVHERKNVEKRINIITPVYNSEKYIRKCIESVAAQDYDNWRMYIIDDCSTDRTLKAIEDAIHSHPPEIMDKIFTIINHENVGALKNQVDTLKEYCMGAGASSNINMLLDGDDWLVNDPTIFDKYNNLYHEGYEFTYGSCWSLTDNIPLIAQEYPPEVKQKRTYRDHKFSWNMPYTHLRTFSGRLFELVTFMNYDDIYQDENGEWFKAGGDGALFYALIEECEPERIKCVTDIVYMYNDVNPLNDYKINGDEQTKNANKILGEKINMKKILIGIPTARYIEPETMKAIYDLEVPEGYTTEFQFFYGYNVDQVRNLIAHWTVNGFDYLFAVDHDVSFPKDTLKKLVSHIEKPNVDMVTGIYRQRNPVQTLELYDKHLRTIDYDSIAGYSLLEVGGCGFGCVLVKKEVFKSVGYPYFVYHSAIDHADTFSEDLDFCKKATEKGHKIYVDTSILCSHKGDITWTVQRKEPIVKPVAEQFNLDNRLRELGEQRLLPQQHLDYLITMKEEQKVEPKVIYDIGSCVLHWTNEASRVWPNADYVLFEAMEHVKFLYDEKGYKKYNLGVLSDKDGKMVDFYENPVHPGGNSYYLERTGAFTDEHKKTVKTMTLDSIVELNGFPLPDLIKMDVQGAEMDILKGAEMCLDNATDVILELQNTEYNLGAPLQDRVIESMEEIGFKLKKHIVDMGVDGDFHFTKS